MADPGGATMGQITRTTRVGFEVRAEVTTADEVVLVTQTRAELRALGLEVGSRVWVRALSGRGGPGVRVLEEARHLRWALAGPPVGQRDNAQGFGKGDRGGEGVDMGV